MKLKGAARPDDASRMGVLPARMTWSDGELPYYFCLSSSAVAGS